MNLRELGQSDRSSLCLESEIEIRIFWGGSGRQLKIPREVDFCKCQIVNLIMGRTLHSVYREDRKEVKRKLFLLLGVYDTIIQSGYNIRIKLNIFIIHNL